ncbi:hypothetical protein [Anaeroselena agilis]|uniref:Uncharacterized protein n=1 Tax=Anaeroselena agilis TaxID=3063788 RepID=A0ABU3P016_9FIRM|nr:hypothetical protein [Selenomonadales bacterium 4137-cl]
MARKGYRAGDVIYLGRLAGGKISVLPVLLVELVSVSIDGELWKVRSSESGDVYTHFIQYPDEEDDPGSDGPFIDIPVS